MKNINPINRIVQKSVGFKFRQLLFFDWSKDKILEIDEDKVLFKTDSYIRHAIDEQIKLFSKTYPEAKQFLEKEEEDCQQVEDYI